MKTTSLALLWLSVPVISLAGVKEGDSVQITVRGIPTGEQEKLNGVYRVGAAGLRLPFLNARLPVAGLEPDQIGAAAERAYQREGIYSQPAIDVEIVRGEDQKGAEAVVSVGGQVKRSGGVPFRQGMTVLQAIQAAGDRTEFGGRNIRVVRAGKTIVLDFAKPEHKNYLLQPNDSIIVEQKGMLERGVD